MKTYKFTIKEVKKEIEEATSVWFDIPIELRDIFKYKSGQHVIVIIPELGVKYARNYSMITNPYVDTEQLAFCVKRVQGGKVSNYINDNVKVGDTIELLPPQGEFTLEPESMGNNKYLFFAGGSGITPIYSMIQSIRSAKKCASISLYYYNRNEESIIFKKQFDAMQACGYNNCNINHILTNPVCNWQGLSGRLNQEDNKAIIELQQELGDDKTQLHIYTCGPGPMMDCLNHAFEEIKADNVHFHQESFVQTAIPTTKADDDNTSVAKITASLDGLEHTFDCPMDETILIAAEKAGLFPPSACRAGQCASCMATLLEGEVDLFRNDVLDDEDIAEGRILTCSSYPKSDKVRIIWE